MQFEIKCQRCGLCCRWPGEVHVSETEISNLARSLGLSEQFFIDQHTRLCQDHHGLALKERDDGTCSFLTNNGCAVNSVKPQQCKDFPSRWVNLLWSKVPPQKMRENYPMLFVCHAFKEFLKNNQSAADLAHS